MLFSNLYEILGVLLVLGLLKHSLTNSGFNSFLTVFLGSCLSFCFVESFFVFLPILFHFTQTCFQSFFVWLKGLFTNSFSFGDNQKENQLVLAIKEKDKEKDCVPQLETNLVPTQSSSLEKPSIEENRSVIKAVGTSSGKEVGLKSSDHGQDTPCCFSPLEEMQQYRHWAGFVISLISIYFCNQIAFGVLRRLNFTQEWAKGMIAKGWPKWFFFWIRFSHSGQLNERALFHLMVCILIFNLLTLYMIVRLL